MTAMVLNTNIYIYIYIIYSQQIYIGLDNGLGRIGAKLLIEPTKTLFWDVHLGR